MHGEIQPLLESFSNQQGMVKEELRRRFTRDPDKFARDAITILKSGEDAPGTRFLAHLVLGNETLVRTIADPAECALEDAVAVARTIARADARLELELDRLLERSLKTKDPAGNAVVLRVLDILDAVSLGNRAAQYQAELMDHADARVRSKAALTIARGSRSLGWVVAQLREGEPRVQANAIEALWGMDNANCRSVFNMAVAAPNSRVVGNALIGLYLMSDVSSIAGILNLAMEADPRRRGTGIWAMGQTQDPRFLPYSTRRLKPRRRRTGTPSCGRWCEFDEGRSRRKRQAPSASRSSARRPQRHWPEASAWRCRRRIVRVCRR